MRRSTVTSSILLSRYPLSMPDEAVIIGGLYEIRGQAFSCPTAAGYGLMMRRRALMRLTLRKNAVADCLFLTRFLTMSPGSRIVEHCIYASVLAIPVGPG